MNCAEFRKRLPLLSGGSVPAALLAAAADHAAGCPGCARLLAVVRSESGSEDAHAPADLLPAVLAKTGGSPCRRIGERLVQHFDGELQGPDATLVEHHLEECAACRELVVALHLLRAELPRLAEAETDVRFVVDVLERTTWVRSGERSFAAVIRRAWQSLPLSAPRLFRRPRVALELAYGFGLFLYLVAGSPHEAMRDLSTHSSAWLGKKVVVREESLPDLRGSLDEAAARLKAVAARPRAELAAVPAPGTARQVVETAGKLMRTATLLWEGVRAAARGLIRGDLNGIWREFLSLREEINRCWAPSPQARPLNDTEPSRPPLRSSDGAP